MKISNPDSVRVKNLKFRFSGRFSGWIFNPGQLLGSKINFFPCSNVHSSNFSFALCKQFRPRTFKSHKSYLSVFGENSINHFEVLGRAEFTNGNWFTQKKLQKGPFYKDYSSLSYANSKLSNVNIHEVQEIWPHWAF